MLFLRQAEPNIRRYLPSFIFSDKTADAIARANNSEHEALRLAVADVANQFYVETATWGLVNWEKVLDIPTVVSDGVEKRRRRILLKLQSNQVSTKKFMTNLINRYTNDDSGFLIEHNEENRFEYGVDIDDVENWHELVNAIDTYKPAHLGAYLVLQILQQWEIHHAAKYTQYVDTHHCTWNLGTARSTYWDAEFNLDGTIRMDGIYPGEKYKERQTHQAEIMFTVDVYQRNYALTNIWDGSFRMDGSHNFSGASMQRLPLLHASMNMLINAKQKHKTKHKSYALGGVDATQTIKIMYAGDLQAIIGSKHKQKIVSVTAITTTIDAKQKNQIGFNSKSTGSVETKQKIKINDKSDSAGSTEATHITDYRLLNIFDGSFCMDGSHAFDGARRLETRINHCCTIEQNGRIERI